MLKWLVLLWTCPLLVNSQSIELCDGNIKLSANATNETHVDWYINGWFSFTGYELTIQDTGIYSIQAIAYNENCEAKFTLELNISACSTCPIYTPNAVRYGMEFTPKSLCWFEFEIYNRWGENLHRGSHPWIANVQNDVYTCVVYGKGYIYRGIVVVVE